MVRMGRAVTAIGVVVLVLSIIGYIYLETLIQARRQAGSSFVDRRIPDASPAELQAINRLTEYQQLTIVGALAGTILTIAGFARRGGAIFGVGQE